MPLMLNDMRKEFARFLAEDPAGRFRMDAALAHVITIAYHAGLSEGREPLHAALLELVTLNRMKDELSLMLLREEGGMGIDYDRRKPLAWERARELVGSNVKSEPDRAALSPGGRVDGPVGPQRKEN